MRPTGTPLNTARGSLPLWARAFALPSRRRLPVRAAFLAVLALWLWPGAASAGPPEHNRHGQQIEAVRIDDAAIRVDGRVDEATWQLIDPLPEMFQQRPRFAGPPSRKTEVRFAYGRRGMYVSFVCHGDPDEIVAPFFSRDQITTSDRVWIEIDPSNDDTTGFMFSITPSGAIADAQIFRDTREERLWDGVWQSAARKTANGWTAEFFVPWSTLRFDYAEEYTFGINAGRVINEGDEVDKLSFTPQGIPGRMSTALHWTGIRGISPGLNFELRPFVSTRFAIQRPEGTLDRSFPVLPNAGFDAKYGIRGNLTLDLAVNPDFGQAEVDPAVLNLGPFEVFFPEKRSFFLESKEIFETHFNLFYTRRVGNFPRPGNADLTTRTVYGEETRGELVELDPLTRIATSLRMTGEIAPGWTVGVLSALTAPTRGIEQFPDGDESPVSVDPMTQWSVLRLRRQFNSLTYVGGMVTNVLRYGDEAGATTGGADYNLVFQRRWTNRGQVIGTFDGERTGMGAMNALSRSGKNTRFEVGGDTLTPHANFSDIGFMTKTNYITTWANGRVFNAQPVGKLRRLRANIDTRLQTSYGGELTEKFLMTTYRLETLSLWGFETFVGGHLPQLDLFETRGGIPYEVPFHWWTGFNVNSPRNKRVFVGFGGNYGEQQGNYGNEPTPGPDVKFNIGIRPVDRLQINLRLNFNSNFGRPRWVAHSDDSEPVFGAADLISTTAVLRGTLGLTNRLSLTSYNQLFYSTAHHDQFFILTDPRTLVPTDPTPYDGVVDQALTSLISNTILRWEYLPGSFFFLAYVHRTSFSENGMTVKYSPAKTFTNLAAEGVQHEDILFVKLVHLFGF